jgi:hypothetical protein
MVLKQWRVKFAEGPDLMLWAKDGEDLRLLRIGGVKSITPTGDAGLGSDGHRTYDGVEKPTAEKL